MREHCHIPSFALLLGSALICGADTGQLLDAEQLQRLTNSCSPAVIVESLETIEGMGPRAPGGPGLPQVHAWLTARLR